MRPDVPRIVGIAVLVAITVCIWYPYGFETTPLVEGWSVRRDFQVGQSIRPDLTARPLENAPLFLGYWLTPDSFKGLGVVLALAFLGRGLAMLALLSKAAPDEPGLGLLAAALWLIFPADNAVWSLRNVEYQVATFLLLVGANAVTVLWHRRSRAAFVAAWLSLSVSLLVREAGYLLVGATLLAAFGLRTRSPEGSRRVSFALALSILSGFAGIGLATIYVAPGARELFGYQRHILSLDGGATLRALAVAARRCFLDAWIDSVPDAWHRPRLFLIVIALMLAASATLFRAAADSEPRRRYWRLLWVGLAAAVVGFLPFAVTSLRNSTFRIYFYPSMGAAVAMASALFLVTQGLSRPALPRALVGSLLVALGAATVATQHATFVRHTEDQHRVLRKITEVAPRGWAPGTWVVLLEIPGLRTLRRDSLSAGLGWAYGSYRLQAAVCGGGPLAPKPASSQQESGDDCLFEDGGVTVKRGQEADARVPWNRVALFLGGRHPAFLEAVPNSLGVTATGYDPVGRIMTGSGPLPRNPLVELSGGR